MSEANILYPEISTSSHRTENWCSKKKKRKENWCSSCWKPQESLDKYLWEEANSSRAWPHWSACHCCPKIANRELKPSGEEISHETITEHLPYLKFPCGKAYLCIMYLLCGCSCWDISDFPRSWKGYNLATRASRTYLT